MDSDDAPEVTDEMLKIAATASIDGTVLQRGRPPLSDAPRKP